MDFSLTGNMVPKSDQRFDRYTTRSSEQSFAKKSKSKDGIWFRPKVRNNKEPMGEDTTPQVQL